MLRNIKLPIFSFFLVYYIYAVDYSFMPLDTSKVVWMLGFFLCIIFLSFSNIYGSFLFLSIKKLFPCVLLFLFGVLIFLLSINGDGGNTIPYYFSIYLIDFIPVASILVFLIKNKNGLEVERVIVCAGLIQAVSIFSMLAIPQLKDFYQNWVVTGDNILSYYDYRRIGVTGFANYTVGIVQATIACVQAIAIQKKIQNKYDTVKVRDFVLLLVLVASSILSSRSSVLVFFFFVVFVFFFNFRSFSFWRNIFPAFLLVLIVFVGASFFIISTESIVSSSTILKWAYEPFLNLLSTGSLTTASSSTLASFYFYPGDETFFYGDWRYVNEDGTYYKHVDAGYMRLVLYMGFPLSLFFYSLVMILFFLMCRCAKKTLFYAFFVSMVFSLFVLHYKGNIFVDGSGVLKIMILISLSLLYDKKLDNRVSGPV